MTTTLFDALIDSNTLSQRRLSNSLIEAAIDTLENHYLFKTGQSYQIDFRTRPKSFDDVKSFVVALPTYLKLAKQDYGSDFAIRQLKQWLIKERPVYDREVVTLVSLLKTRTQRYRVINILNQGLVQGRLSDVQIEQLKEITQEPSLQIDPDATYLNATRKWQTALISFVNEIERRYERLLGAAYPDNGSIILSESRLQRINERIMRNLQSGLLCNHQQADLSLGDSLNSFEGDCANVPRR